MMEKTGLMSNLGFRGLALVLRQREKRRDLRALLVEAGLSQGQVVLDYGCGIGSYALPAARIVGPGGMVHALDIHPLAVKAVERRATEEGLVNLSTIQSDLVTGLPENSVDTILLFDVLHHVTDREALLRELHRVLRGDGQLLVIPDHMDEETFQRTMTSGGLFAFRTRHGRVSAFGRCEAGSH
jgi:ubiquinone/menaquinone biosynthesis C-methylase UbiE